jgi:hypothetical protein
MEFIVLTKTSYLRKSNLIKIRDLLDFFIYKSKAKLKGDNYNY